MSAAVRQLNKIFVTNLPWTVNTGELRKYFVEYGQVSLVRVVFDMETGLSKGYGYVAFNSPESVESVLKRPYHIIEGHHVIIQPTD